MATEYWVQAKLFPDTEVPDFWAYEMSAMGGTWWEVWDVDGVMCASIEPENFGDFLEFCRTINYDVKVNTYESWEAMDECMAAE